MSGLCKDCFWWEPGMFEGWGECELSHGYGKPPDRDNQKAWAYDNEAYHAVLITAPDFGCNQWEVR